MGKPYLLLFFKFDIRMEVILYFCNKKMNCYLFQNMLYNVQGGATTV